MSTGTVISFATEPSSFAISTSIMRLLLLMPCLLIGPFILRDLVYHYWLVDPGQVLCVGLILPCRNFRPFLSRLATAKAYQCMVLLLCSIHSYPPKCGGQLSVSKSDASRVASSPSGGSGSFSPLGSSRG